jgi:platelet-activating factor acetylhydrolase
LSSDDFFAQQLDFRQAEWNEIGKTITSLNNGSGSAIYNASSRGEGESLSGFKDRLDLSRVVMSGHSFGANSVFRYLRDLAPTLPAKAAVAFDPGKDSGPLTTSNQTITVPLLIAQSEEWSAIPKDFYGQPHFQVVKAIAEQALNNTNGSWFMTLAGTVHTSITDVGIIAPSFATFFTNNTNLLTLPPATAIAQYVNVTNDFFGYVKGDGIQGLLNVDVKYPNWQFVANATALGASPWEVHVGTGVTKKQTSGAVRPVAAIPLLVCIVFGMFIL